MSGEQKILGWFGDAGETYKLMGQPSLNYEPTITNGVNTTKKTLDISYKCPTYLKESIIKTFDVDNATVSATVVNDKSGGTTSVSYGAGWRLTRLQSPAIDEAYSQINIHYEKSVNLLIEAGLADGLTFVEDGSKGQIKYNTTVLLEFESSQPFRAGWELVVKDYSSSTSLTCTIVKGYDQVFHPSASLTNPDTGETVIADYNAPKLETISYPGYSLSVAFYLKYNNAIVKMLQVSPDDFNDGNRLYARFLQGSNPPAVPTASIIAGTNTIDQPEGTEQNWFASNYGFVVLSYVTAYHAEYLVSGAIYESIDKTMYWDTNTTNKIKLIAWGLTFFEFDVTPEP